MNLEFEFWIFEKMVYCIRTFFAPQKFHHTDTQHGENYTETQAITLIHSLNTWDHHPRLDFGCSSRLTSLSSAKLRRSLATLGSSASGLSQTTWLISSRSCSVISRLSFFRSISFPTTRTGRRGNARQNCCKMSVMSAECLHALKPQEKKRKRKLFAPPTVSSTEGRITFATPHDQQQFILAPVALESPNSNVCMMKCMQPVFFPNFTIPPKPSTVWVSKLENEAAYASVVYQSSQLLFFPRAANNLHVFDVFHFLTSDRKKPPFANRFLKNWLFRFLRFAGA